MNSILEETDDDDEQQQHPAPAPPPLPAAAHHLELPSGSLLLLDHAGPVLWTLAWRESLVGKQLVILVQDADDDHLFAAVAAVDDDDLSFVVPGFDGFLSPGVCDLQG